MLQDRFEELRSGHQQAAKATARTALADPSVYDLEKLNNPQRTALVKFWEAWQDELATVRILDPACGSGAFLIEAFDQLHTAYGASNDRLEELRGHRTLFDLDRQILQNNLYGVDLNEEAIEICRLSLWIKTARRGKILTSLDHMVRVGNSVVSDPSVHEKALDRQAAFPEVFESGGFDVVVGNPPYIRQEWLTPYKAFWQKHFEGYHGTADIFAYFYELGINLLRDGGRLGFITSGSWGRANLGAPLRKFLSENAKIESMIDFGEFQPLEGAEMIRPTITVLQKARSGGTLRIYKWLTKGTPPESLSDFIVGAPTIRTNRLGSDAWELEPDDVIALREKPVQQSRPLAECIGVSIYRGILTGLTDAFVLSPLQREELIAKDRRCESLIKPFAQGTHLRPWYVEQTSQYLIAIKSSANFTWPWTDAGERAEQVFGEEYPAIYAHLSQFKARAVKRQDQGEFWWELRSCSYWEVFEQPKIVWPDISKLPRFSMDMQPYCLGNTAYTIPTGDYFVLGVLSSWATWFFISKTAQPLRLRGDRWQYPSLLSSWDVFRFRMVRMLTNKPLPSWRNAAANWHKSDTVYTKRSDIVC